MPVLRRPLVQHFFVQLGSAITLKFFYQRLELLSHEAVSSTYAKRTPHFYRSLGMLDRVGGVIVSPRAPAARGSEGSCAAYA